MIRLTKIKLHSVGSVVRQNSAAFSVKLRHYAEFCKRQKIAGPANIMHCAVFGRGDLLFCVRIFAVSWMLQEATRWQFDFVKFNSLCFCVYRHCCRFVLSISQPFHWLERPPKGLRRCLATRDYIHEAQIKKIWSDSFIVLLPLIIVSHLSPFLCRQGITDLC